MKDKRIVLTGNIVLIFIGWLGIGAGILFFVLNITLELQIEMWVILLF